MMVIDDDDDDDDDDALLFGRCLLMSVTMMMIDAGRRCVLMCSCCPTLFCNVGSRSSKQWDMRSPPQRRGCARHETQPVDQHLLVNTTRNDFEHAATPSHPTKRANLPIFRDESFVKNHERCAQNCTRTPKTKESTKHEGPGKIDNDDDDDDDFRQKSAT